MGAHEMSTKVKTTKGRAHPRVSVALEDADRQVLEQIAEAQDRSLSWIASRAIRFFLEERQKGSQLALDFERAR